MKKKRHKKRRTKRRRKKSSGLEGLGRDIRVMSKDIVDLGIGLTVLGAVSGVARDFRSS